MTELSAFDIDLASGKTGEMFVDDICKMLGQRSGSIEVKTDHRFLDTNRFFIETEYYSRKHKKYVPSGIQVTKAKLWALVWGRDKPHKMMLPAVLIVETEWIRKAVALARTNPRNVVEHPFGDNPSRGVCIYINHLVQTKPEVKT